MTHRGSVSKLIKEIGVLIIQHWAAASTGHLMNTEGKMMSEQLIISSYSLNTAFI
jgi:hypothetical protein